MLQANGGGRVLGIITPIYNEAACTACHVHPASQRVLGILDVRLSMAQADAALRTSERQMQYGLFATGLAVLLLSFALLFVLVMRPVKRLRRAMERAGAGDLDARVPVRSGDEMGDLARSWNAMTGELQHAREDLEGLNRTLEERVLEKTQQLEHTHRQMVVVEKMASLGKLAAVVAHEINNPLAGIRTYARLLRRQLAGADVTPPSSAQLKETDRILEMVDSEAGRCGDIVRNLLAFSRQAGARFAPEDLATVVERCRLLLNHQAEMLGVTLETRSRRRPAARGVRRRAGAADAAGAGDERARGDALRRPRVGSRRCATATACAWSSPTRAGASRRSTSTASSSPSSRRRRLARASGSGWRSSTASSTATTARSTWSPSPAAGPPSRFGFPRHSPRRRPRARSRQRTRGPP